MILKMNRDYFHNNNKLDLRRISLHPISNWKNWQIVNTFLHIRLFFFQLTTGGIESAVYKKLIAPFKNDLPATNVDGWRRVCTDHKYAYVSLNHLITNFSLSLSCQLVPLPDIS